MVWCQEEPKNQGGWTFVEPNLEWVLGRIDARHGRPIYVGPRRRAPRPPPGSPRRTRQQQAALVDEALTIRKDR